MYVAGEEAAAAAAVSDDDKADENAAAGGGWARKPAMLGGRSPRDGVVWDVRVVGGLGFQQGYRGETIDRSFVKRSAHHGHSACDSNRGGAVR